MLFIVLSLLTVQSIQAENLFNTAVNGQGFVVDPFLELTGGVTVPPDSKSSRPEPACFNNGTLTITVFCTLLLSALVGFLIWLIYLREKLQELQLYKELEQKHIRSASQQYLNTVQSSVGPTKKRRIHDAPPLYNENPLPLDVTDCKVDISIKSKLNKISAFGTFPFRQSQPSSPNGHYNHTDWFHRIPSSFRSVNDEQDNEVVDIELLDPSFCGLNFSITGNMRAGIFIKEILEKDTTEGCLKLNSSDQLRTGDRILALTVCFQSIVYEDALTILSYASPYPVILRVQRALNPEKHKVINEKRAISNSVRWRDDFEHYDNDTSNSRSMTHGHGTMTVTTDTKPILTPKKKNRNINQQREKSSTAGKMNKIKSNTSVTNSLSGSIRKRSARNRSKISSTNSITQQTLFMSTGLTSKPVDNGRASTTLNKSSMKSVTNAVISYLHYRGSNAAQSTGTPINADGTIIPYYDSPYDYFYDGQHSHLNRNNNNSTSPQTLTSVTPMHRFLSSNDPSTSLNPTIEMIAKTEQTMLFNSSKFHEDRTEMINNDEFSI